VKIRAVLTTGAAMATVAAVAFAAPSLTRGSSAAESLSPAAAAQSVPTVAPPPGMRIHVLNLHQQYARALAQKPAVTGPEAGVVPMLNGHGPAAAGTATTTALVSPSTTAKCKEPDCNLKWGGGPVQHAPHVYLLLWGPDWTDGGLPTEVANYLTAFYAGLGSSSDSWSTITSQYKDKTGHPTFVKPVFDPSTDVFNDPTMPAAASNPKTGLIFTDIGAEALTLLSHITDTADAQVVVASQSGTCFGDGFAGSCGALSPTGGYCGWHDAVKIPNTTADLSYTNLPWQLDAGVGCGQGFVNGGSAGLLDGWSLVGGHEYAEAVTDPAPNSGWIDLSDLNVSGGEIADKCVWGGEPFNVNDPDGDVTLTTGKFAMQSLWSNAAGRCVMTTSPRLYVAGLPAQKAVLGKAISLPLTTVTNTGAQKYKATGLPHGLSINAGTGRISGKPAVTAGTFKSRITISDYAKSVTIGVTWYVSSAPGAVKGFDAKCVDSSGGRSSNGNKIDIWSCTGKAPQQVTFAANRELRLLGKCVTGGSVRAFLEPCTDASNQAWTRQSNGEYVLAASGKCLTDPGSSTRNGTALAVAACKNTANQHWSLP
jgi:Ricin-type beta-trefoil lectin domain/Putative Ig domain